MVVAKLGAAVKWLTHPGQVINRKKAGNTEKSHLPGHFK